MVFRTSLHRPIPSLQFLPYCPLLDTFDWYRKFYSRTGVVAHIFHPRTWGSKELGQPTSHSKIHTGKRRRPKGGETVGGGSTKSDSFQWAAKGFPFQPGVEGVLFLCVCVADLIQSERRRREAQVHSESRPPTVPPGQVQCLQHQ